MPFFSYRLAKFVIPFLVALTTANPIETSTNIKNMPVTPPATTDVSKHYPLIPTVDELIPRGYQLLLESAKTPQLHSRKSIPGVNGYTMPNDYKTPQSPIAAADKRDNLSPTKRDIIICEIIRRIKDSTRTVELPNGIRFKRFPGEDLKPKLSRRQVSANGSPDLPDQRLAAIHAAIMKHILKQQHTVDLPGMRGGRK